LPAHETPIAWDLVTGKSSPAPAVENTTATDRLATQYGKMHDQFE